MSWTLVEVLICIFFSTSHFEYFFTCVLAICVSSNVKFLTISFTQFSIELFMITRLWEFPCSCDQSFASVYIVNISSQSIPCGTKELGSQLMKNSK